MWLEDVGDEIRSQIIQSLIGHGKDISFYSEWGGGHWRVLKVEGEVWSTEWRGPSDSWVETRLNGGQSKSRKTTLETELSPSWRWQRSLDKFTSKPRSHGEEPPAPFTFHFPCLQLNAGGKIWHLEAPHSARKTEGLPLSHLCPCIRLLWPPR